jgi:serine/threonine-protein kinase
MAEHEATSQHLDTRRYSALRALSQHDTARSVVDVANAAHDKYVVSGVMAEGSMGRVLSVRDNDLHREVVVKTLPREVASEQGALSRFLAEAQITGQLEHPNIVPVYDFGVTDERLPYYTMRRVDGRTLQDVVDRLRRGESEAFRDFPLQRRLHVVLQICEALDYAHSRGVLHGDLKPANIMIGRFGEVTVMDWGIATVLQDPSAPKTTSLAHQENGDDTVYCTLRYAPPEVVGLSDLKPDARSDVYSLGALMYELCSLRMPYEEIVDRSALEAAIMARPPKAAEEWPQRLQNRVPREVSNIIKRAMARRPAERYASVRDMANAILAYQQGEAPVVCACTGLKRGLNVMGSVIDNHGHAVIWALILLGTATLALGGWALLH